MEMDGKRTLLDISNGILITDTNPDEASVTMDVQNTSHLHHLPSNAPGNSSQVVELGSSSTYQPNAFAPKGQFAKLAFPLNTDVEIKKRWITRVFQE